MSVIKKSEHKNATRSRRYIKQAFGELLNEKDLNKITVTDIVERANISRGTFYAHYLDIYDLYNAIQNNVIETIDLAISRMGLDRIVADPTDAVRVAMEFLEKNKNYYKLFVCSAHAETLISRVISYMETRFGPALRELFADDEIPEIRCFLTYTLGAFRSVIVRWFYDELDFPAAGIAKLLTAFYMSSRPAPVLALDRKLKEAQAAN